MWATTSRPPWDGSLLANNDGVWAPDGLYLNGKYLIYYAYWSDANKSSAVALLSNPTLDPSSPKYKWTDGGVVVPGPAGVTHSVIDPCPVLDAQGNLWVTWGGGYPFNAADESLWVTRLDNSTGLPLTTDAGWKPPDSPGYPIEAGHKEGSFLYYHSGYYYLFWQTGNAFDPNTSYTINMARSTAITGPYSGDTVFYSKNPAPGIYGPGHMGIYSCNGVERFTYHFYANETNSGSTLGENALTWGSDGWPVAGAVSTTPFTPCSPDLSSGTGGTDGGNEESDADSNEGSDAPSTGSSSESGVGESSGSSSVGSATSSTVGSASASSSSGGASESVSSGASTSGHTSNSTGGSTDTSGNTSASSGSGCSCGVAGGKNADELAAGVLLVGLALSTRRRRR